MPTWPSPLSTISYPDAMERARQMLDAKQLPAFKARLRNVPPIGPPAAAACPPGGMEAQIDQYRLDDIVRIIMEVARST